MGTIEQICITLFINSVVVGRSVLSSEVYQSQSYVAFKHCVADEENAIELLHCSWRLFCFQEYATAILIVSSLATCSPLIVQLNVWAGQIGFRQEYMAQAGTAQKEGLQETPNKWLLTTHHLRGWLADEAETLLGAKEMGRGSYTHFTL